MPGALGEYRRKRDFEVTSEPAGATEDTPASTLGIPVELPEGIETGAFVVQQHEGGWAFTRIEDRRSGGVTWLMVKRADATADPERDVVTEMPRSVLSGLTVDELGATGGRPA